MILINIASQENGCDFAEVETSDLGTQFFLHKSFVSDLRDDGRTVQSFLKEFSVDEELDVVGISIQVNRGFRLLKSLQGFSGHSTVLLSVFHGRDSAHEGRPGDLLQVLCELRVRQLRALVLNELLHIFENHRGVARLAELEPGSAISALVRLVGSSLFLRAVSVTVGRTTKASKEPLRISYGHSFSSAGDGALRLSSHVDSLGLHRGQDCLCSE